MKQNETLVSPKGEFGYSHLIKPGKFGHLDVQLILEGDEAEKFSAFLAGKALEARKTFIASAKTPKEAKAIEKMPVHDNSKAEEDDDGNETGRTIFSFKNKAEGIRKDGSPFKTTIPIVDAKKKAIVGDPKVGKGTIGKIAYQINPYATSQAGVGVSLRLKAVQILELVQYTGGGANAFGQEEGYETQESDIAPSEDAPATSADKSGDF